MIPQTGTVQYGSSHIDFDILYVSRKTLEIAVYPDTRVLVKAPLHTLYEEIIRRVSKRARWIIRQINYFRQFEPRTPARQYIGGETHLYLGRQYRLKLINASENKVKLARGYFFISAAKPHQPEQVKSLLDNWYLEKAKERFNSRFEQCWQDFRKYCSVKPDLQIRRMRTRWGSLSKQGTLTLNVDLIRAPGDCIDYVITHELCHLKYHDHSPRFYQLLDKVLPDWEKRKHKLELSLI